MIYISTKSGLPLTESIANLIPRQLSKPNAKITPPDKIYVDRTDSVYANTGLVELGDSKYNLVFGRTFSTPNPAREESPNYQGVFELTKSRSGNPGRVIKALRPEEIELMRELGVAIANRSSSIEKIVLTYKIAGHTRTQIEVYSPLRL